ncbi:hypothetical protein [Chitinophaga pinensis]|uniref:Uncharacterized protein n=1 Tax=Chitinophaga pinensis TaxID=79329 RepID=A0A5C6LXM3_9BACT|nr:hypothetical protein [Chitinophaga pinensis]TWW01358.1 hypothetical protein FEF09_04965 [Chitinophaga pinensis]
MTGTEIYPLTIDAARPFTGTDIAVNVSGKGTLIVTVQVTGMTKDRPSCNRQYMAADIIAVMPPLMYKRIHHITYPNPLRLSQNLSADSVYTQGHQLMCKESKVILPQRLF